MYITIIIIFMILQAVPVQQKRMGQLAPGIRSSPLPTDYMVEIGKALVSMDGIESSLKAPELSAVVFEDFSFQEDALKVDLQAGCLNSCS